MREMSTLCSAAMLRTSGVDLVRSRCSAVWTPPPSPLLTGAGASGLGDGGGGVGVAFGWALGEGVGTAALGGWGLGGGGAGPFACLGRGTNVWRGAACPFCILVCATTR